MPRFDFDELVKETLEQTEVQIVEPDKKDEAEETQVTSIFEISQQVMTRSRDSMSLFHSALPVQVAKTPNRKVPAPQAKKRTSSILKSIQISSSPVQKSSQAPPPHMEEWRSQHAPLEPVPVQYPSKPSIPLDAGDLWRNDMGLFMGRSFRACFSPSGKIYIPRQNYGSDDFGHKVDVRDVRSSLHDTSEGRRSYVELMKAHHEKLGVGDSSNIQQCLDHYCSVTAKDRNLQSKYSSFFAFIRCLLVDSSSGLLDSFSDWLQGDLKQEIATYLQTGGKEQRLNDSLSDYDRIFVHLTGRQIDHACTVAMDMGDFELALLVAQLGESTNMAHDMIKQVEWMEVTHSSYLSNQREYIESKKLLQIYRLLAGDIDALLATMCSDYEQDLKDPSRYAYPNQDIMKLPPEGMRSHKMDLFSDKRKLHFSLQGAFQYFIGLQWQTSSDRTRQIVPHPWPAFLQTSSSRQRVPKQLVRKMMLDGPSRTCAFLPDYIQRSLGLNQNSSLLPARLVLLDSSSPSSSWPVDMRLQLLHLMYSDLCGKEASLSCLLDPQSSLPHEMDWELSWHVCEIFSRCKNKDSAQKSSLLGRMMSKFVGSEEFSLLRLKIALNFASQLEMSGQWEMSAYVLLACIDASMKMETLQDEAAEQWEALYRSSITSAFRSLLARHSEHMEQRGYDITVKGVCVLQESEMLQKLCDGVEVRNWFTQAQAWSSRQEMETSLGHRRLHHDRELSLCLECHEGGRAHELVLQLLHHEDLLSEDSKLNEKTILLLRRLENEMSRWRREWVNGAAAILALLEVMETIQNLEKNNYDLQPEDVMQYLLQVQGCAKIIASLSFNVQRACEGLLTKVAVALWQFSTDRAGSMGSSYKLNLPPGKQLGLVQQLAVSSFRMMSERGRRTDQQLMEEDEEMMERETEEC
ncbi:hypothetical protein GUITHDRAFT_140464 [Guillardia theta CCMP2712]|uniref:Nuclear pore complex protein NUP96 C-terminal domain-containing protein n=1 Tax=Guillardia theta (strain CCMP2712) TaxID=905079 RepID=L1J4G0_GUITC|nr:hypothetical protein GUITHDRAFT_140464 [Guillardia theta CCMP2712]EKX43413.1 hypothetical protein GUITHDRAFT_140464 [Guillardia theta CCMP2712]|eukprot:XP_005830393.1 hypothetical protein GUITHDRAFT_140464 [Guillardia theta CCMP2712]